MGKPLDFRKATIEENKAPSQVLVTKINDIGLLDNIFYFK